MPPATAILFVDLGNLCRSPMAEALMRHKLRLLELEHRFTVDSAATSPYLVGQPTDPRTKAVLKRHGIAAEGTSRRITPCDLETSDHVLAMDHDDLRALERRCPTGHAQRLHLVLEPTTGGEVPDPYYCGKHAFKHVFVLLDDATDAWLKRWLGTSS